MAANSPDDDHGDSLRRRPPVGSAPHVRSSEDIAELAATGGALVTAIIAQRWNEANRSWLQRRIGAAPFRQTREETTVRVGALLGGVLTYLLAVGATEGLVRLRDQNQQREVARSVCRILGAAATAPDGSMPDEASLIVETALMGMGVTAKSRKRLLAEPRPATVSDLGACPLPEPLLSAVAVIAFNAMAEASNPDDAFRQAPGLLRRMGLARPAAETKAREILDEYRNTYVVLSDVAARLRPEMSERPRQLRPPVSRIIEVGAAVNRRNPNEADRQITRQAMIVLLRHGARAAASAGGRVHPAVLAATRLVSQLLGEEGPQLTARPANSAFLPEAPPEI